MGAVARDGRPLVNPDDTERSVSDSEGMVVSLARQTALGRLADVSLAAPPTGWNSGLLPSRHDPISGTTNLRPFNH